jgi:hypothetical protein
VKHHLRKEKNCLNCGSEITDRYCTHCGQENIEPKETVGYLVRHFLGDITHYDSKFLTTIRDLLLKPGFLTKEYLEGRRTAYLNPIRMYVFISAFFFLLLFLVKDDNEYAKEEENNMHMMNLLKQHLADSLRKTIQWPAKITAYDSGRIHAFQDISAALDTVALPTSNNEEIAFHIGGSGANFVLREDRYNSLKEYDSVQNTLSGNQKDKGFMRWVIRSNVRLKEKYGSRRQVVVSENFQHSIPKLMFVLLPVFALFVYMLHNKKKYYYAQHIIFSIHFHSFLFFILLIRTLLGLINIGGLSETILSAATWILSFIYLVIAMKNVYHQSAGWSLLKTFTILILYIIALVIGIGFVAAISFFTA